MRLLTVDAFTDQPFRGNPAAVCLLDGERDAEWMQKVAAEMNLSETAFLLRRDDGWSLRWFTPAVEVDEDPVTGSAHTCLAPYWSPRLGKDEFVAYQASKRGGILRVRLAGDRVKMAGRAVTVLRGELVV